MSKNKDQYGPLAPPVLDSQAQMEINRIKTLLSRNRGKSRKATWVIRIGILVIILLILGIASGLKINADTSQQNTATSERNWNPAFKVRYADLGRDVVSKWYNKGIQPIPVGDNVVWPGAAADNGASDASAQQPTTADAPMVKLSSVSFLQGERYDTSFSRTGVSEGHVESLSYLVLVNGKQYVSSITLNVTEGETANPDEGKPVLTSVPTLTPYMIFAAQNKDASTDPTQLSKTDGEANEATKTAIQSFLTAWTKSDPVALKQIVQDNNPDHAYFGLGNGWTINSTTPIVNWSRIGKVGSKDYAIMSVSFTIQSFGPVPETKDGVTPQRPVYTLEQTLEITVDKFNSGLPSIVAWGSSGSWPTLEPYSNAVNLKGAGGDAFSTESAEPTESTDEATTSPSPTATTPKESSPFQNGGASTPTPSQSKDK